MINTKRPLEEKMALFWHGVLCTGYAKVDNARQVGIQIDMFRRRGLGNFRDLLIELSQDPAMVYFLDNVDNHKNSINENYGRELLELFSMGVGMDGPGQLHGGRRQSLFPGLHRLELGSNATHLPLRPE